MTMRGLRGLPPMGRPPACGLPSSVWTYGPDPSTSDGCARLTRRRVEVNGHRAIGTAVRGLRTAAPQLDSVACLEKTLKLTQFGEGVAPRGELLPSSKSRLTAGPAAPWQPPRPGRVRSRTSLEVPSGARRLRTFSCR